MQVKTTGFKRFIPSIPNEEYVRKVGHVHLYMYVCILESRQTIHYRFIRFLIQGYFNRFMGFGYALIMTCYQIKFEPNWRNDKADYSNRAGNPKSLFTGEISKQAIHKDVPFCQIVPLISFQLRYFGTEYL